MAITITQFGEYLANDPLSPVTPLTNSVDIPAGAFISIMGGVHGRSSTPFSGSVVVAGSGGFPGQTFSMAVSGGGSIAESHAWRASGPCKYPIPSGSSWSVSHSDIFTDHSWAAGFMAVHDGNPDTWVFGASYAPSTSDSDFDAGIEAAVSSGTLTPTLNPEGLAIFQCAAWDLLNSDPTGGPGGSDSHAANYAFGPDTMYARTSAQGSALAAGDLTPQTYGGATDVRTFQGFQIAAAPIWNSQGNRFDIARSAAAGGYAQSGVAVSGSPGPTTFPGGPGVILGAASANRLFIDRAGIWHLFGSMGGASAVTDDCPIWHGWNRGVGGSGTEAVLTGGNYRSMCMDWGHGKDGNAILGVWTPATRDWQVTGLTSSNGVSGWTAAALQPLAEDCEPIAGIARDTDGSYWFAYCEYSAVGEGVFKLKRARKLSDAGVGTWSDITVPVPVMSGLGVAEVAGICNAIGADVKVLKHGLLWITIFHHFDFSIGGFFYLASRLIATYDDADPEILTWSDLKWSSSADFLLMEAIGGFVGQNIIDSRARGEWPGFGSHQNRDGRLDYVYVGSGGGVSLRTLKRISKDGVAV